MKTTFCAITCLTALSLTLAHAQPTPGMPPPQPLRPPGMGSGGGSGNVESTPLTKFDLDFPGGTPKDLVAAIQKAMGRPLNAIIPDDLAATKLPALKMNSVDVSQLFKALTVASVKSEAVVSSSGFPPGRPGYSTYQTNYGFRQGSEGRPSDDTIWYFYVEKPVLPPPSSPDKVCRFYSLAPYLDSGVSVDDITTAMETGWKLLGETVRPTISFHKDTKLLIAVGEERKLEIISDVLRALTPSVSGGGGMGGFGGVPQPPRPRTAAPPPAPAAK